MIFLSGSKVSIISMAFSYLWPVSMHLHLNHEQHVHCKDNATTQRQPDQAWYCA